MKPTAQFNPVRTRRTVQDQVYDQLRIALVNGAFEAGENFTISSLAEKFETSHMPVREALRRLAAENALRISSTGTAVVPDLDLCELREITQARMILEPATAELAFDNISKDIRTNLGQLLDQHQKCGETGDVVTMLQKNREFHFVVYGAAKNAVLISQIENLWLRSGAYVRFLSDRMGELLQTSYKSGFTMYHQVMLDAHDKGDKAAFVQTMADDIWATHKLLASFLEAEQNLAGE